MKSAALITALLVAGLALAAQPSLNAPGVVTHGPRTVKQVALTFDADMTPGMKQELKDGRVKNFYNREVIEVLTSTNTPATIFMTGMWAEVYPKQARAIAANPLFEVENHSYDHPGFSQPCYGLPGVAQATKLGNMLRSSKAIETITQVTPKYFRFPGGCAEASDVKLAEKAGMKVIHWDVIGGDVNQPNARAIVQQTLSQVQPGSIIVLHISRGHAPATGAALPAIIAGLKAKSLTPVTLNTLFSSK
ncbi:polysaccharide deacetylase family protein [Deinococcus sp.]|uniref:polysaccharide deacetylase family protein n=1 Tax=Deinococcus sp. TaxID=47478 RepID=UPI0025B9101A|nr:polysaccharide deacetylase family protein [Deinococcus sp.]